MTEQKHKCQILVCPDCGAKYSAKTMEMLVFVPFNMQGKRNKTHDDSSEAQE